MSKLIKEEQFKKVFEVPVEPTIDEKLETKPKSVRTTTNHKQMVLDLELALVVRDRYIKTQQEKIDELSTKIRRYQKFLHEVELNYTLLKDYQAVQRLIDKACLWSQAHRHHNGEFAVVDRHAAVEIAERGLADE
jgi:hypothetical protein